MSSAIPIYNGNDSSVPIQISRESLAHSQGLGGISWGGASVGSWLRDEVLMATKDHQNTNDNENHNSSISLLDSEMHEHLADIKPEETHDHLGQTPPLQSNYFPKMEAEFCKDFSCCGNLLPTLHDLLRHYEEEHISPSPPEEPPVIRRMQNIGTVSTIDVFLPFEQHNKSQSITSHPSQIGDPSLDSDQYNLNALNDLDDPQFSLGSFSTRQQQPQPFAPPSFQYGTHPIDPISTLKSHQPLNLNNRVNFGDDDEPTIDDPARQLYMLGKTENKPYKCPVIGCEKTYKNQNGLKYHRQHGHQNQTLHQNEDGSVSIIDPLSNAPYPDGMGMEKDKPYQCEICGKRYKNLNGLKYHRAHSTH